MSEKQAGLDKKRLWPILLIIFTNILGAGVIMPILPLYAEGEFGGTILQITLLATAFFGAQFLAAPWMGRLSDRVGRRPVLLISQAGTVLAFILFIFAGPLGQIIDSFGLAVPMSGGMIMLYIARILDGITGGNITTAQAYISDITPEKDRAQGLGLLQAAFGVGFIFGPAFGGVLSNFGPTAPFIGAAIITSGTLILTLLILDESLPAEDRAQATSPRGGKAAVPMRQLLGQGALINVLLIGFFASLAFSAIPATFSLFADHVLFAGSQGNTQLYIGLMMTFLGMMQVITQLALLKPLVVRLGERKLLLLGQSALMISMFSISQTSSALLVTLLMAPFSFGQGVSEPNLQSIVTRFGTRQTRGQLLGLYQSARSLALIIGPLWSGYVFDQISPQAVYIVCGLLVMVSILLVLRLLRQDIPLIRSPAQTGQLSAD